MAAESLDQLRGFEESNHSDEVHQTRLTVYMPESAAAGYQVLRDPLWNKGDFFLFFLSGVQITREGQVA